MCLMQTDFPVPDGPRIIEILPSGMPRFRPRRTRLRPNALWTSMNWIASGTPSTAWRASVWYWNSSSWGADPGADSETTETWGASSGSGSRSRSRSAASRGSSPSPSPSTASVRSSSSIRSRSSSEAVTRSSCRRARSSADDVDLGMGGEQRLGEDVVEGEDAHERYDHRLVDRAAHSLRPTGGGHALVAAHDRDDRPEQRRLEQRAPQVGRRGVREEGRPERPERRPVHERGEDAAEDAEQQRVDVEQAGHEHQREEARHDEVLDRVDAEHLERVELLADLARAEVRRDRRPGDAGEHDRRHERRELADRGEHEEPAEAVDRAEQDEEVRRLQARRAVAERHRGDQQREPAQLQREQELRDELAAVRIRRTDRGDDRLAREDHHVADLLEGVPRWRERSVGDCSDHLLKSSCGTSRKAPEWRPPTEQGMARKLRMPTLNR